MIEFNIDKYKIAVQIGKKPDLYDIWLKHAVFKDIEGLENIGTPIYVGIQLGNEWCDSIIAFCSDPIDYAGFNPGILVVPETDTLFIGAGTVARTYDLKKQIRKFHKEFIFGFWGWSRHKNLIIMQEELEFGVYSIDGNEKWSTYVEPPWTFSIEDDRVKLTVMDKISYYSLETGKMI